jgi:hypothetical protein
MSCDCLARLERALKETLHFNRDHKSPDRYYAILDVWQSVQVAQQNVVPIPGTHGTGCCCPTCNPLASNQAAGAAPLSIKEFERLRAWEQWGREVAVPTLEHFRHHGIVRKGIVDYPAPFALAARPKDVP